MTLSVKNLSGGYQQKEIISDLNFIIQPGEIVGLVGLNGAGKSTTIRHIMGLMKPFKGTIQINGQTISDSPKDYFKALAYIPESPQLYEELTFREHIELTAMTYDIPVDQAMARAQKLIDQFRLNQHLDWFPVDFSKGMKQKVMIICAFLTEPDLLIIDEPFIGLDPLAMRDLIQVMDEARIQGTAILMSTHVLANVKKICDRVMVLHDGKMAGQGTIEDLSSQFNLEDESLDGIFDDLLASTSKAGVE